MSGNCLDIGLPLLIGYSFIGCSGGEILHQMLLRQGVKVCHVLVLNTVSFMAILIFELACSTFSGIQVELSCMYILV